MMRIDVVTLFPEMIRERSSPGIQGRALTQGLLELVTWNPRDFSTDRHRNVGPHARVIYLSPQGQRFTQDRARELAQQERIILVAGRYEGIDERIIELEVDEELSVGDYVLSGGELPALLVMDAVTRLLPGALGDADSAQQDSFMDGLLDYPHYTRPEEIEDMRVPDVLIGGNHAAIRRWRHKQALGRTWQRRPDLLENMQLDAEQQALLNEFIEEYKSGN